MGVKTDERRFEPGFVALVTQLNKAIHRRSSEELLGMRLKPYMTLGYIRDHPGVAQGDLEAAMFMDANTIVLLLKEVETDRTGVRERRTEEGSRGVREVRTGGRNAMCVQRRRRRWIVHE